MKRLIFFFILIGTSLFQSALCQITKIVVKCDSVGSTLPVSGKLYFILKSQILNNDVIFYPDYINPEPFFSKDFTQVEKGQTLILDSTALGYPSKLNQISKGIYLGQAILNINTVERSYSMAPGNTYSAPVLIDFSKDTVVTVTIDHVIQKKAFEPTSFIKELSIPSKLLSDFYHVPTNAKAAIILPPSYWLQKDKFYPTVYVIPGYGGTHYDAIGNSDIYVNNKTLEKIYIVLNPESFYGHHVFADSENNGPRATSLITEIIPFIENEFRALKDSKARFLEGHSSGGWSSLWLQVNYPKVFAGAWALAPDPVDFTSFDKVDLYKKNGNIFYDGGKLRVLTRIPGDLKTSYKELSDKERVLGYGEQLGSFEAVFSPKAIDGRPEKLWDRSSGMINPEILENWQKYDISRNIVKNWPMLKDDLAGKLHIYVGADDNFYLEAAVRAMKKKTDKLNTRFAMEILNGHDHFSIYEDKGINERINNEIEQSFKQNQ